MSGIVITGIVVGRADHDQRLDVTVRDAVVQHILKRRWTVAGPEQLVLRGPSAVHVVEVYGTPSDPHHNEKLVGRALADIRNKVVIFSKFGLSFDMSGNKTPYPLIPDARPETIRKSVEGSLKRLNTDHIDLYFQHRIDPDVEPEEVAGVMADLIREGKITHWGISEANETYLRRANAVCPVTAVENRYSMMARQYEALFPVLEELRVGFIADPGEPEAGKDEGKFCFLRDHPLGGRDPSHRQGS